MEEGSATLVRDVLAAMTGRPCWGVRQRWGSSLILEFGEPHLQIFEPIYIRDPARYKPSGNPAVDKVRRRRKVVPVGQWHLWIHMSGWRLSQGSQQIAHSESDRSTIEQALRDEVDGKILAQIIIDAGDGTSTFVFEEDVRIDAWPIKNDHKQFHVFEEKGSVLVYRGDGAFHYGPANTKPNEVEWFRSGILSLICAP